MTRNADPVRNARRGAAHAISDVHRVTRRPKNTRCRTESTRAAPLRRDEPITIRGNTMTTTTRTLPAFARFRRLRAPRAAARPRPRDPALPAGLRLPALRRPRRGRPRGDRLDARPVPPLARPARRRGRRAALARHPRRAPLRPARAKDEVGTEAYADDGIVQQAVRVLKDADPALVVITDVCLCEYTSHGHCGVVTPRTATSTTTPRSVSSPAPPSRTPRPAPTSSRRPT